MESVWFALHPNRPHTPHSLRPDTEADVLVVGAGLTGLATAVLLARAGQRVVVLEEYAIGAVTTGHTTAKVSLLQGSVLQNVRKHHSAAVLQAYVEANREGQAWLARFLDTRGVGYQRRPAWTYAGTQEGLRVLREELDACHAAGLDVTEAPPSELPFPVAGAITLADQIQVDPLLVLDALYAELVEHGGVVVEGVRATDVEPGPPAVVTTSQGQVRAARVVLATGTPFLDRGGYFAKLVPQRSYATTYRVPGEIPQGMYLSIDEPTRSLRTVETPEGQLLMVGGNGHVTGRSDSPSAQLADLDAWTRRHFPGAQRAHAWSAQDYQPADHVPYVGPLPRGGGSIYVATGFNKWGMANAVAAGLNLSGQMLDGHMEWARTLTDRPGMRGVTQTIKAGAEVAGHLVKDWVDAELSGQPDQPPAEGQGIVVRGDGGKPEAISTVDGRTCRVSGVCTHLGGVLRWNDAERSWDCPLHGSRFSAGGRRLEGPAVEDLEAR